MGHLYGCPFLFWPIVVARLVHRIIAFTCNSASHEITSARKGAF